MRNELRGDQECKHFLLWWNFLMEPIKKYQSNVSKGNHLLHFPIDPNQQDKQLLIEAKIRLIICWNSVFVSQISVLSGLHVDDIEFAKVSNGFIFIRDTVS